MRKFTIVLAVFWLLVFFADVPSKSEESDLETKIVAQIGERKICIAQFQDVLLRYRKGEDMDMVLKTLTPEGRVQLLDELIDIKLLSLWAKDKEWHKESAVRWAVESAVDSVLARFAVDREVNLLDLSDKRLRRYYQMHKEEFRTGCRIKARHINTRTREDAEIALLDIKKGANFAEVASERNIDATKSRGGDLGWIRRGIMVKVFEDVLFSLKAGEVSDIVETTFGFHVIKVEEIDPGKVQPFDSVREKIKNIIIEQHISEIKENIKKKYPVKVDKPLLEKIGKDLRK